MLGIDGLCRRQCLQILDASHQLKKRASHLLKVLLRVLVLRFPLIWLRRNVRPNARRKIREVGTLRRLGLGKGSKGKSEGNQYGAAGCIFVESWTVHCFLLSVLQNESAERTSFV